VATSSASLGSSMRDAPDAGELLHPLNDPAAISKVQVSRHFWGVDEFSLTIRRLDNERRGRDRISAKFAFNDFAVEPFRVAHAAVKASLECDEVGQSTSRVVDLIGAGLRRCEHDNSSDR